jgi:hypothetical protein
MQVHHGLPPSQPCLIFHELHLRAVVKTLKHNFLLKDFPIVGNRNRKETRKYNPPQSSTNHLLMLEVTKTHILMINKHAMHVEYSN